MKKTEPKNAVPIEAKRSRAATKKPQQASQASAASGRAGQAAKKPKAAVSVAGKRVFFAPEGDKRLTINLRSDLHKKLKIMAAERETTVGEIIEALVEQHL